MTENNRDPDVLHGLTRLRVRLAMIEQEMRLLNDRLDRSIRRFGDRDVNGARAAVEAAKQSACEASGMLDRLLADLPPSPKVAD